MHDQSLDSGIQLLLLLLHELDAPYHELDDG